MPHEKAVIVLPEGRAPQGARGLKLFYCSKLANRARRAPQGARGLKFRSRASNTRKSSRAPQGARGLK